MEQSLSFVLKLVLIVVVAYVIWQFVGAAVKRVEQFGGEATK